MLGSLVALAGVLLALGSTEPSSGAPVDLLVAPADCSAWTINGYSVGMPEADALAVRAAKRSRLMRTPDHTVYSVKSDRWRSGYLFVREGALVAWSSVVHNTVEQMRLALEERLGPPSDFPAQIPGQPEPTYTWRNEECDAMVSVGLSRATALGSDTVVVLASLSKYVGEAAKALD